MSAGFLLIDGSNIAHAANHMKPLRAGDQPTQAVYGFLRTMRVLVNSFHTMTPIVLWDGKSWRYDVYPDYKGSRNKEPKTKYEIEFAEKRKELKPQLPFIRKSLIALGVRQMAALNYEADDLAALLVNKAAGTKARVVLVSGDKDWVQLVGPQVGWFDPIRNVRLTEKTLPKRLGLKPSKEIMAYQVDQDSDPQWKGVPSARAFLEIKALMGDSSDDIPGVGGVGPTYALELVRRFGSLSAFVNGAIVDKSIDLDKQPKWLSDLARDETKLVRLRTNLLLMDLRSKRRPAPVNQVMTRGAFDADAFRELCDRLLFTSISSDIDGWCAPFKGGQA